MAIDPGGRRIDALRVARQRCWRYDWVLDLDIKGFFDNIDWELLMRAVRRHTDCTWVLLYIERWLKAPVSMPDGTLVSREKGTPQGAVVSPVLGEPLSALCVRSLDDGSTIPTSRSSATPMMSSVTVSSEAQARSLREALEARFAECKLELHPQKTQDRVLQGCQSARQLSGAAIRLPGLYVSAPAVDEPRRASCSSVSLRRSATKAAKAMRQTMRRWQLHQRNDLGLEEIARWTRPMLARLGPLLWAFLSLGAAPRAAHTGSISWCDGRSANTNDSGATRCVPGTGCGGFSARQPPCSPTGPRRQRLDDRSRMNREVHVRFWEGVGVRFPRATRLHSEGAPAGVVRATAAASWEKCSGDWPSRRKVGSRKGI